MTTLNDSKKKVGDLLNETNQNNYPFYYLKNGERKRVLTFIDDDGGPFVLSQFDTPEGNFPGFWLSRDKNGKMDSVNPGVIDQIKTKYPNLNFKMGFAIITGFSGIPGSDPKNPDSSTYKYPYLPLNKIKDLQNKYNNEIYSHTVNHANANANEQKETTKTLSEEYRNSREWLLFNGFSANSNILVYPGGLEPTKPISFDSAIKIAKEYYDYAVNTELSDTFEPTMADPKWTLRRIDFDKLTKEKIEEIIEKSTVSHPHGWFIAMTHAYNVSNDQHDPLPDAKFEMVKFKEKQNKILAMVDYCVEQNIDILPFSEAIKHYLPL